MIANRSAIRHLDAAVPLTELANARADGSGVRCEAPQQDAEDTVTAGEGVKFVPEAAEAVC